MKKQDQRTAEGLYSPSVGPFSVPTLENDWLWEAKYTEPNLNGQIQFIFNSDLTLQIIFKNAV